MFSSLKKRLRRDTADQEALGRTLRELHDRVIADVEAGHDDRVRALVASTAAVELLDPGNDLYPRGHSVYEFTGAGTREDRARLTVSYLPADTRVDALPVVRHWRCARDARGTWTVTDIARPIATSDTGDPGADPGFALGAMGGVYGMDSDPERALQRERMGKGRSQLFNR